MAATTQSSPLVEPRLLTYTYNAKNTDLRFCTIQCSQEYADYQLSNTKSRCYLAIAGVLALFIGTFATAPKPRAEEHHHKFHDFYKEWKIPGTQRSCCNARFDQMGVERGDCEVSIFELRQTEKGAQWFAYVPMLKRVIPVPDEKIIRAVNPDPTGRDGHTCVNRYTKELLCAVPPTGSL